MNTAKDMKKVYARTSTVDLIKNKGRKQQELLKVCQMDGYWARKEVNRLVHMIGQIDAVLEARARQHKPL